MTSKPDPDERVDLSNTLVVGSAVAYAGGTTSPMGTGSRAVHGLGLPGAGEVPGGTRGLGAGGIDRSRKATSAGGAQWSCPFPEEADREHIDQATVEIRVTVRANGTPTAVAVLRDPGHGFAGEAQRCALRAGWTGALDRDGTPVESTVIVNVHFER